MNPKGKTLHTISQYVSWVALHRRMSTTSTVRSNCWIPSTACVRSTFFTSFATGTGNANLHFLSWQSLVSHTSRSSLWCACLHMNSANSVSVATASVLKKNHSLSPIPTDVCGKIWKTFGFVNVFGAFVVVKTAIPSVFHHHHERMYWIRNCNIWSSLCLLWFLLSFITINLWTLLVWCPPDKCNLRVSM